MEKTNNSQFELFSQSSASGALRLEPKKNVFLSGLRRNDKVILSIIVIAVLCIASFALGVEKGRRLNYAAVAAPRRQPQVAQQPIPAQQVKPQPVVTGNYLIQLATYKNMSFAQKEAQTLKQRGFTPVILTKKGYAVLYVGNITNVEAANMLLAQLKKRYSGCILRRL